MKLVFHIYYKSYINYTTIRLQKQHKIELKIKKIVKITLYIPLIFNLENIY